MSSSETSAWQESLEELEKACRIAIEDVLKVKKEKRVLIITNPEYDVYTISKGLYRACLKVGAAPVMTIQQKKSVLDFAEEAVIGAIKSEPDVVISMSAHKMGKDRETISHPIDYQGKTWDNTFHFLLHGKKSLRAFWSPSTTIGMFEKTVPIDYKKLKKHCAKVKEILDKAESVHIVNEKGTDIEIGVEGRKAMLDDGDFSKAGSGGNLPAGETFISPALGASNGRIAFDGSISTHDGVLIIQIPIVVDVTDGFITEINGAEEADKLAESIKLGEERALKYDKEGKLPAGSGENYKRNARNLGELGIGLNPKAEIVGRMLEDEKAHNTCHIAVGANYDEDAPALIHLDGLITKPTITARLSDGKTKTIMEAGKLL